MHTVLYLKDALQPVHAHMDRVGWALIHVGFGLQEGAWTYSIGLSAHFGHPELIVMGLHANHGEHALDVLAVQVAAGTKLRPGDTPDVDGLPMLIAPVHDDQWRSELFGLWHQVYLDPRQEACAGGAVQVLWPDNDGYFPGDPSFEPRLAHLQPLLGKGAGGAV